jgi:hypothetical protein
VVSNCKYYSVPRRRSKGRLTGLEGTVNRPDG